MGGRVLATRQSGRRAQALALLTLLAGAWPTLPEDAGRTALVLTIDGPIGPASADYFNRGLDSARGQGAAVVVLQLDTPGGLDTSMREMIRAIIASPVPVVTYVAPSGARAASAGTYMLYASHVAAMAPGTNLGAATPVQIGGETPLPGRAREPSATDRPPEGSGSAPTQDPPSRDREAAPRGMAMESKLLNDAVAYIRSLAELRGRNADWAEASVRMAASLPAREALERNVVDIVAVSLEDLLAQAHGREVTLGGSTRVRLDTRDLVVSRLDPDWRTRLLTTITNPNLALILILVGVYGLFFEFMNPGALVPGTIGAISLLVGLYALSALSVTFAGAALLVLGIGLMIAEAFTPSIGVLGIGGVVAFVLGAIVLFDTEVPGMQVSVPLVTSVAIAGFAFAMLVGRLALRSRRRQVTTGTQTLIGATAKVTDWRDTAGHVFVEGERWAAQGPAGLRVGEQVLVTAVDGLRLRVTPLATGGPASAEENPDGRTGHVV